MGAIVNGLNISGFRAFGAGFLIFSDYMKASMRLAAIMHLPSIFVFTHDSIGLGEDGPTHQPVEQLVTCARRRASTSSGRRTSTRPRSPGGSPRRETTMSDRPRVSRQGVPTLGPGRGPADAVERGATCSGPDGDPT